MNRRDRKSEGGQSLVLFAIMLVALLGILGLVLDGGNLYAKRRTAQNAADAGALAGARALCLTKDATQAIFMAHQYAEVHNDGVNTPADVQVGTGVVTVTTQITTPTYFARFIGFPTAAVQATAAAGCFSPTFGVSVLPIAWACRPPIVGGGSSSPDCQEKVVTPAQALDYYNHQDDQVHAGTIPPELYIVMDSNSLPDDLSTVCQSQGGYLPCDLDGDGDDDLVANGDRSWLDLDGGGGGSSELIDWINGGFGGTIVENTWLGGQSGAAVDVFHEAGRHVGEIVAIPVFNVFCDDYPDPRCSSLIQPGDTIVTSAGGNYYYRIVTFAAFFISCVDPNPPGWPNQKCPGHELATDYGVIPHNSKTIEGYFVSGIIPGLGGGTPGGGIDTGVYTLKLIR